MRVFLTGPTAFVGSVFVQDRIRSRSMKARSLRPHISDDFLCFAERFVIAIATAHMTMAVISGFGPGLFNPLTHVTSWSFFALWIIALILSMRMPIHAIR